MATRLVETVSLAEGRGDLGAGIAVAAAGCGTCAWDEGDRLCGESEGEGGEEEEDVDEGGGERAHFRNARLDPRIP